jgi:hypothetical protein
MMAHSGGDGMAWRRRWRRDGLVTVRGGARHTFCAGKRVNGEETGRAVAGDERVDGRSRARGKGLTSGACLPEKGRSRGRKGGCG